MAFIFKVQTVGVDDTFTLPLIAAGTYDCVVDWGDGGATSEITTWDDADKTHTYAVEGLYTISVTGTLYGWSFNNGGDCAMMRDVSDWGTGVFRMGATTGHFHGCANLTSSAANAPDITGTTSLANAFNSCTALIDLDLTDWDVSNITSFNLCWGVCSSLTSLGDLSNWNVSNVTDFYYCWGNCLSLTSLGDLSNWDVSSTAQFICSWLNCSSLTSLGDLSNWDVSSITSFMQSWYNCSLLTTLGDLSNWNVSNITSFSNCWYNANNALTDENYSNMLVAWSKLTLTAATPAHFGDAKYFKGAPTAARALIDAVWGAITDGGQSYIKYPSMPGYLKEPIQRNLFWNKRYIDDMWGFLVEVEAEEEDEENPFPNVLTGILGNVLSGYSLS